MTATLRHIDPAIGHEPHANSPTAQRLLAGILEQPRVLGHRSPRRIVLTGAAAAIAALAVFLGLVGDHGSHVGAAAYAVSRDADGTVHVDVRWSMVRDPAQLQAALDRAHARTEVFVLGDADQLCPPPATVSYDTGAVDWHIPASAGAEDGIVLQPDRFPPGATFVLVVSLASDNPAGGSTLGPTGPSITGTLSYMETGPVTSPAC